jgi:UDP-GlcNAc:undecaprenyl-phosphate/decaprenyl-phosphate GlcNAc-1-phosphate transferase
MTITKSFTKSISEINKTTLQPIIPVLVINLALTFFQLLYLNLRFEYLNRRIPIWYTLPWGTGQLGPKSNIFLIPAMSLIITTLGALHTFYVKRHNFRYGPAALFYMTTTCNLLLTYSLIRIISIAAIPFDPLINPTYVQLFIPFATAFSLMYFFTPKFIEIAENKRLVTNPLKHNHPAMILTKPSARGGGFLFTLVLLVSTLLFVQLSKEITGLLLVTILLALLGLLDDFQNTQLKSRLKILEKPWIRLVLILAIVSLLNLFDTAINKVNNPFDGILQLDVYRVYLGNKAVGLIPLILTTAWITWILNLLSWSNGIDGQYSGIVGIVSLVIAILALRFTPIEPIHRNYAKLAAIAAGASFGLTKYTWQPSKIMWGFGAISAGVVISTLSILINSKITTSILILLIPFLDALVTITRRLLQRKNPLKGDRGHLHHILLDRGWRVPQIAIFYWATTAIFGIIGIASAEKYTLQTVLTFAGVVAFFIISLNLKSLTMKQKPQEPEK